MEASALKLLSDLLPYRSPQTSISPLHFMSLVLHTSSLITEIQNSNEMAVMRVILTVSALISVLSLEGVLGDIVCENLPMEVCAFSVSSSGERCVLEKSMSRDGNVMYECQSSEVIAEKINEWIETEECMNACGVERMAVGMSTDALVDGRSARKLCSPNCYNKCANILELYFNLAAGEGIYLPRLCETHRSGDRRMIREVISQSKSSITAESFAAAPASSPSPIAGF